MWACREGLALDRPRFHKLAREKFSALWRASLLVRFKELADMLNRKQPKADGVKQRNNNNSNNTKKNKRNAKTAVNVDVEEKAANKKKKRRRN